MNTLKIQEIDYMKRLYEKTITVFMTSSSLVSVTAKRKNKSIYQEGTNKVTF